MIALESYRQAVENNRLLQKVVIALIVLCVALSLAIATLFPQILKDPDSVEYQLALRQLVIKDCDSNNWFITVNEILLSYNVRHNFQVISGFSPLIPCRSAPMSEYI
jgi:type IV secretory pathway component VirB8